MVGVSREQTMTRSERQEECVKNWIKAGGKGCVIAPTGLGFLTAVPIKKFSELSLDEIGESTERRDSDIVQRRD